MAAYLPTMSLETSKIYQKSFLKDIVLTHELTEQQILPTEYNSVSIVKDKHCSRKSIMYDIYQENGQRKYGGPPKNWTGPPPPKGTEVFVNRLPRDCMEDEIIPIFERIGNLYCLRLMMDFSGSNRGFCFVQFATIEQAKTAITDFNGFEIRPGKKISVIKSVNNCRLFVGHIPKELDCETIQSIICKYTTGVADIILYLSSTNKKMNRGFCFIEYEDHRSAAMARRHLMSSGIPEWNSDIMIDWAIPEEEVDPIIMEKVTIMYVRNMMLKTTEKTIREALMNFVTSYEIKRIRKLKDFAFVHFSSRDAAQTAITKFNGFILEGAQIEATWAKPIMPKKTDQQQQIIKYKKQEIKTKYREILPYDYNQYPIEQYVPLNQWSSFAMSPAPIPLNDCYQVCNYPLGFEREPVINYNENISEKALAYSLLNYATPSVALVNMASILKWGKLSYIVNQTLSEMMTLYTAQICIENKNKNTIFSDLQHHATHTSDEAQNAAAQLFFNVYIFK